MNRWLLASRRLGVMWLIALLAIGMLPVPSADASIETCVVTRLTSESLTPGAEHTVSFRIQNVSGPTIVWIQATAPNTNYKIVSASTAAPDWQANTADGPAEFRDGALEGDGMMTVNVVVRTGLTASASANWTVLVSENPGGNDPTQCTASLPTSIEGDLDESREGQGISGVAAAPTQSSAVLSWTSSVPTSSAVFLGDTSDYGQTFQNGSLVTNHQVIVNGLSSSRTYHFQVAGLASDGTAWYSGNNTFVTYATEAEAVAAGTIPVRVVTIGQSGQGTAQAEKTPPTVTLSGTLAPAYTEAPVFTGAAADNVAVVAVEYSIDGGKNWSAATVRAVGNGRVTYTFRPVLPEDGNYPIVVRATDAAGNWAMTSAVILVIDRLPPRMGSQLMAVGSQALEPDRSGRWPALENVDQTITLNAVGGPIRVSIEATREGAGVTAAQRFGLRRNPQTGLWSGVLGFSKAGVYQLRSALG